MPRLDHNARLTWRSGTIGSPLAVAALHLLTGPSINFSFGGRVNVERFDVGFVVGGGSYRSLLTVEGRYEEGLKSTRPFYLNAVAVRNRAFLLLFGVRR